MRCAGFLGPHAIELSLFVADGVFFGCREAGI